MKDDITDESYIGLICNGKFNALPQITIGELFESFFENINYNLIKEKEKVFVDFTGDALSDGKPCNILIRFKIYDNAKEFEISYVKLNEEFLGEDDVLELLEDIAYAAGVLNDDDNYEDEDIEDFDDDENNYDDEGNNSDFDEENNDDDDNDD